MPHTIATYDDALRYLFGRINYERIPAARYTHREFKLERMQRLLASLGDPHLAIPAVHIAGTKGKGSTAVMLAEMLAAAGHRVGLFTSPHIHAFEERMQVNGRSPSPAELTELTADVAAEIAELDALDPELAPTYFEVATAIAWLYFARQKVDLVVLEVGLGGRLDATNLCRPLVCVVTNISLDHTQLLGETCAEIAAEKAGIIKPGVPVISGVLDPEAAPVIHETCHRLQAPLWELGEAIAVERRDPTETAPSRVTVQTPAAIWSEMPLPLLGDHQGFNAALALAALDRLSQQGFGCSPEAARAGLSRVKWPVRIEVVAQRPAVILDAAHNPAAIEALVQTLGRSFHARRRILVFGTSQDKDASRMLALLAAAFDEIVLTEYTTNPRACPVADLHAMLSGLEHAPRCHATTNPREAWGIASNAATADDLICITGSFFLVAEVRADLLGRSHEPAPRCVV